MVVEVSEFVDRIKKETTEREVLLLAKNAEMH